MQMNLPEKIFEELEDIKTKNILKTIQTFCSKNNVSKHEVDFEIKKTLTYIKKDDASSFELLNDFHKKSLETDEYILSPKMQIEQEYIIRLKSAKNNKNFSPIVSISTDSNKSLAKILFKKGSILNSSTNIKQDLHNYLNKIKAKNKMLINIRDTAMNKGINTLIAKLDKNDSLQEDVSIWLAKWKKPVLKINDKITYKYIDKTKKKMSDNEKINYADRNFIIGVKKSEILIEYTKPKKGCSGRSYSGKFIEIKSPTIDNIPSFKTDLKTIEIIENEKSIQYKAKTEGFVSINENTLSIQKELQLKNVNLRATGYINPGIDSGVKVIVETKDYAEDAVGADMLIEANEIIINGSVGPRATIKGKNVVINGQTHSTTTIYANNLEAKILKGKAYVVNAKIKSFENATMFACSAQIEQLFTGNLNAKIAKIKEVRAPCEIRAFHSIHIEDLNCGDNKLYIDSAAILSTKQKIEACKAIISESKKIIQISTKDLTNTSKYIKDNQTSFQKTKSHIEMCKEKNETPNLAYTRIFKEYLTKAKRVKKLQKKIDKAKENIASSQKTLDDFDEKIKNSFIYNQNLKWKGTNNVYFVFHGRSCVVDRIIENLPAVEIIGLKETEKETYISVGTKNDFLNIDINSLPDNEYSCEPLKEQEENNENQTHPKEKDGS